MYGFTPRELRAACPRPERPDFLDRLARSDPADFARPTVIPDLPGYIELAVGGGLPLVALSASSAARALLDDHVDQLLTRNVSTTIRDRDTVRLARYFEILAASSEGIPEHRTLYDAAAIDRRTARAYDALLESPFIVESVPAPSSTPVPTRTSSATE